MQIDTREVMLNRMKENFSLSLFKGIKGIEC
jgi:hypothetical protein